MRKSVMTVMASLVVGLAFLAGVVQGCGGGSGTNAAALCDKSCKKSVMCGSATDEATCKTQCMQEAMDAPKCSNDSAIFSAVDACLGKANCDDVLACLLTM